VRTLDVPRVDEIAYILSTKIVDKISKWRKRRVRIVKGELDLWYEMWDRTGSQGLDTWYDMRGRLKGEEEPSAVQDQILDGLDATAGVLWDDGVLEGS
jgi:hypothetical protein